MVLPKNAVQFSSFFKYAILADYCTQVTAFLLKVAKLPGWFDGKFTKSPDKRTCDEAGVLPKIIRV
jgi:hypothetical protein